MSDPEAILSEIARALDISVQAAWGRARRQGWPHRYETMPWGRGVRKVRLFPVEALPPAVREAVQAARHGEAPPAIDSHADCADLSEIAAALGTCRNTAARMARAEEWIFDERVPRSLRGLGSGRPSDLYPLAALPRYVRFAVRDRRAPDPDEPCARCEKETPGNLLCICARCGESVCADCMADEYCGQCRRETSARERYRWPAKRRAAAALAANRAARGEGIQA